MQPLSLSFASSRGAGSLARARAGKPGSGMASRAGRGALPRGRVAARHGGPSTSEKAATSAWNEGRVPKLKARILRHPRQRHFPFGMIAAEDSETQRLSRRSGGLYLCRRS